MSLKKSKNSILILVIIMLVVIAIGRWVQVSEDKVQREAWSVRQAELLKASELENKLEKVKEENATLKKQVSAPVRDRVVAQIKQVFGIHAKEALAVVSCENNLDKPNYDPLRTHSNSNGTVDHGVFQINSIHAKRFGKEFMNSWKENIQVAYKIFKEQGTNPWYSSERCWKDRIASK